MNVRFESFQTWYEAKAKLHPLLHLDSAIELKTETKNNNTTTKNPNVGFVVLAKLES